MYSHNELIILVCYISRALCFPRCRKCNPDAVRVRGLLLFKCTLCELVPYMRSRSAWTVNKHVNRQLPRVIAHLYIVLLTDCTGSGSYELLHTDCTCAVGAFADAEAVAEIVFSVQWMASSAQCREQFRQCNYAFNWGKWGLRGHLAPAQRRDRMDHMQVICTSWHILNTFKTTQPQHDYDHYVVLVRVSYWI